MTKIIELAKHLKLSITKSETDISLTSLEKGGDGQYHASQSLSLPLGSWPEIVQVVADE